MDSYAQWTGENSVPNGKAAFDEILRCYARVREQLAGNAYLLDTWLSDWLEAVNAITAHRAAEKGQEAAVELRFFCRDLLVCNQTDTAHPFYKQACAYVAEHPPQCRDLHTKLAVCFCSLAFDFLADAASRFRAEQERAVREVLDVIDHEDLYCQICRGLGGAGRRWRPCLPACGAVFFLPIRCSAFIRGSPMS